jgi:tetratricopeptide (TPR) repeat protein
MKGLLKDPKTFIKELFKLEQAGRYDEALYELRDIWDDTTAFPKVEEFEPKIAAELILRCGCLIGYVGHNKQLPNALEKSKNLLSDAHRRFLDIYDIEKVAECENHLALAYWRTGELGEAEIWIEAALRHDIRDSLQTKVHSYIIQSKIFFANRKYETICQVFSILKDNILQFGDDCLKGDFYNHLGLAFVYLNKTHEAFTNLKLARHFHQKSGHQIYLGTVENNISYLYKSENNFEKAHESIDSATEIFRKIRDKTREGFSLDTKAQIYFAEKNYLDALKTVESALKILQRGENAGYLAETYLTKSKILLALNDFTSATFALFDGVQIAKTKISEEVAANLIKEFEAELIKQNTAFVSKIFSEEELISGDLQLSLPPSISHYSQYQAVRIKNTHLEKIGLTKNSLAIVVDEIVSRGDLAAVSEIKDGSIFCGYFDSDFGIVCLEGIDSEPQLLNESEVKILGKIVGVCDGVKNANGKLVVKPL